MTAVPAGRHQLRSGPDGHDLFDEATVLLNLSRHSGGGTEVVLVAATVSNAGEIVAGRGAGALDAVVHELVGRAAAPDLGCRLLSVSDLGVVGAVVVPRDRTREAVRAIADRLAGLVDLGRERLWPAVTVGALVHRPPEPPDAALRTVRAVMLEASRIAPGTVRWHDPDAPGMTGFAGVPGGLAARGAARIDVLELVPDLAEALHDRTDQIDLAYQPMRRLVDNAAVGAEALIRWTHPRHGPISPQATVRLAEEHGLIRALGSLALDRALAVAADVRPRLGESFRMHVNVSPIELREPGYVEGVRAALTRHDVPSTMLLLELTETALMSGDADVVPVLAELRTAGVEIGIDDFGTGYSSIARLHRLPIDTVKVDRSFIAGIATSPEEFDLVCAVFRLLGTTGVRVVAEGVETAVQVAHLRAAGCHLGQGLLLGPPGPASALG